jgi:hypothetical protein
MKSFQTYLMESQRTYHYVIKLAGDVDSKFIDMFTQNLKKFDPVKIEDPKTTPIQREPHGFPELENETVTIIKAEFKYPATEPMIQQIAQLLGRSPNHVRITTASYEDGLQAESDKYAAQASPILTQTEMEDGGKQASKDYANQYLDQVVPKKPTIDHVFAAKSTPIAKREEDKQGTQSPMTTIKRPDRPKTGSAR